MLPHSKTSSNGLKAGVIFFILISAFVIWRDGFNFRWAEIEYLFGIEYYLETGSFRWPSLNDELETVYFVGLHGTRVQDATHVWNPKSWWTINTLASASAGSGLDLASLNSLFGVFVLISLTCLIRRIK